MDLFRKYTAVTRVIDFNNPLEFLERECSCGCGEVFTYLKITGLPEGVKVVDPKLELKVACLFTRERL